MQARRGDNIAPRAADIDAGRRPVVRPSLTLLASCSASDIADARTAPDSPAHRFLCLHSQSAEVQDHPAATAPPELLARLFFALHQIAQQVRSAGSVILVQIVVGAGPVFAELDEPARPFRQEITYRVAADLYAPTISAELAHRACTLVRRDSSLPTPVPDPAGALAAQRAHQRARAEPNEALRNSAVVIHQ